MIGVQLPQGYRATTRRFTYSLFFTSKFPEISGIHLTDLGRKKG